MDRNDKIKQKYSTQKSSNPKRKDYTNLAGNFDPDPYVDVIFEKMEEEMEYGDMDSDEFFENIMDNPKLAIIFGKGSALNIAQKAIVISHLQERIRAVNEFDTTSYVDKLVELFSKRDFDQFKKYDSDGDYVYDFRDYFKHENLTKEQLELIQSDFDDRQIGKAKIFKKKLTLPFLISVLFLVIPPFFIPNIMQSKGLLSVDAGWFTKIIVGVISMIILFFLIRKLFGMYAKSALESENIIIRED